MSHTFDVDDKWWKSHQKNEFLQKVKFDFFSFLSDDFSYFFITRLELSCNIARRNKTIDVRFPLSRDFLNNFFLFLFLFDPDKLSFYPQLWSWIVQANRFQSPHSHLWDYSTRNNYRLVFNYIFLFNAFVSKCTLLEKWLLRLWGVEFKMSWSNTFG